MSRLDRAQLLQATEAYLAALAARAPAGAGMAPSIRYTENGQLLDVGDGFWATCSGRGTYQHLLADPVAQQTGFIGTMLENGTLTIVGLRLRFEAGLVTEAETVVSRDPILFYKDGPQKMEAQGSPLPIFTTPIPPASRPGRAQLIAIADAYFSALEQNDGHRKAPLAAEVDRWDNGVRATHAPEFDEPGQPPFYALGAAEQLALGYFQFVTRIRDRRFAVVDEELGTVMALTFMDHAGTVHDVTLTDGRTVPVGVKRPFSWQIMDMLRIEDVLIRQMEVLLNLSFYGMRPGWPD